MVLESLTLDRVVGFVVVVRLLVVVSGVLLVVVACVLVVVACVLVVVACVLVIVVAGMVAVAVQHQGQVQVGDGHHALVGGVEGNES